MKKQRHTGRTILLIVLAIIILIPVAAYGYLAISCKNIEKMQVEYDPDAAYGGAPSFPAGGGIEVKLTVQDVYWLVDHYDVLDDLSESGYADMIKAFAFDFREGGITLRVSAKVLDFLPVPLVASADVKSENGEITASLREVRIGSLFKVPLETLASFDVPETFTVELDEEGAYSKTSDIRFLDDGAIVKKTFGKRFMKGALAAANRAGTACALYVYEGEKALQDDPLLAVVLGEDPVQNGEYADSGALLAFVNDTEDREQAWVELLALCTDADMRALPGSDDVFDAHFIFEPLYKNTADVRAAYLERVAAGQTVYEGMVNEVRGLFLSGGLTLDFGRFLLTDTGEPLVLSALCPEADVDDAKSRIVLLHSNDALYSVMTSDMPALESIPRKNNRAIDGIYTGKPYDLGVLLPMPCGENAMLYRLNNGDFIINWLPPEMAEEILALERIPDQLSDDLPRKPQRLRFAAPAKGLHDYSILSNVPLHEETAQ